MILEVIIDGPGVITVEGGSAVALEIEVKGFGVSDGGGTVIQQGLGQTLAISAIMNKNIDAAGFTMTGLRNSQNDNEPITQAQLIAFSDAVNTIFGQRTFQSLMQENPQLATNLDGQDAYTLQNIRNAVSPSEPATKAQMDAFLQTAKEYADTVSANTVRWAGFWDASAGTYPSAAGIRRGDEYEISVDGNLTDGTALERGDVLRARINSPGQIAANWSVGQGNTQQATESVQGTAKVVTSAVAQNPANTNNKDFVTAVKMWEALMVFKGANAFLTPAQAGLIGHSNRAVLDLVTAAFTTGLKLQYDGYAAQISTNNNQLAFSWKAWIRDTTVYTVTGTGIQAFNFNKIPANALRNGSRGTLEFSAEKTDGTSGSALVLAFNTSASTSGGQLLATMNVAATIIDFRFKVDFVLQDGNIKLLQATSTAYGQSNSTTITSYPFDPTVDYYFYQTGNTNSINTYKQKQAFIFGIY